MTAKDMSIRICLAALILTGALAGCSKGRSVFVLMPEPDGTTGRIEIANEGGVQVLSDPKYAVFVKDSATSPPPPEPMDDTKIEKTFKDALAVQPQVPKHYNLYFKSGSTELTPEAEALIPIIVADIKSREITDVGIVGHTDRVGSRSYNLTLSLERAQVVKKILENADVAIGGIEISSHGEENPLIPTPDNVAEPRNRRVEAVVR